ISIYSLFSYILCYLFFVVFFFFFFQAEDGIRDDLVTGVQTCALPILLTFRQLLVEVFAVLRVEIVLIRRRARTGVTVGRDDDVVLHRAPLRSSLRSTDTAYGREIGRASCRESVECGGMAEWWTKRGST